MIRRRLDYLVIGHVTQDREPSGGFVVGGTAAYAARTARALGFHAGVITSTGKGVDLAHDLRGIDVLQVPAPATTTFDNRYTGVGRTQTIEAVAAPLTPDVVPSRWRTAGAVHLAPVACECDPALATLFPGAFLGLTPQGWMRRWDASGRVRPAAWEHAETLIAQADAVVLSEGDVGDGLALLPHWARCARTMVITRGAAGCTVYADGEEWDLPAFPATQVDPTGAGDVFAAVFFLRLWRGDDPRAAARLANCLAAVSVTRSGLSGTPTPQEVAHCRALCA